MLKSFVLVFHNFNNFPDLFKEIQNLMVDESRELAGGDLEQRMEAKQVPRRDPVALASVVQSALIGFHLAHTFFGRDPAGVSDDRFVKTLAELVLGREIQGEVSE